MPPKLAYRRGKREGGEESASKHQIRTGGGRWAGQRRVGRGQGKGENRRQEWGLGKGKNRKSPTPIGLADESKEFLYRREIYQDLMRSA